MLLKYYFPEKDYTYKELAEFSEKAEGKWTWATVSFLKLKDMGFDIVSLALFDWLKFSKTGLAYLEEFSSPEVAKKQAEMSDIHKEMKYAAEFVEKIKILKMVPQIKDIEEFLEKEYLLLCNVNSKILNGEKGYSGHAILVYKVTNNYIFFHDPGLPPKPNRRVTHETFNKAWAYPNERCKNLVAFKH